MTRLDRVHNADGRQPDANEFAGQLVLFDDLEFAKGKFFVGLNFLLKVHTASAEPPIADRRWIGFASVLRTEDHLDGLSPVLRN